MKTKNTDTFNPSKELVDLSQGRVSISHRKYKNYIGIKRITLMTPENVEKARIFRREGKTISEITHLMGVSYSTVSRLLNHKK